MIYSSARNILQILLLRVSKTIHLVMLMKENKSNAIILINLSSVCHHCLNILFLVKMFNSNDRQIFLITSKDIQVYSNIYNINIDVR